MTPMFSNAILKSCIKPKRVIRQLTNLHVYGDSIKPLKSNILYPIDKNKINSQGDLKIIKKFDNSLFKRIKEQKTIPRRAHKSNKCTKMICQKLNKESASNINKKYKERINGISLQCDPMMQLRIIVNFDMNYRKEKYLMTINLM